jgi:hypothetical protein
MHINGNGTHHPIIVSKYGLVFGDGNYYTQMEHFCPSMRWSVPRNLTSNISIDTVLILILGDTVSLCWLQVIQVKKKIGQIIKLRFRDQRQIPIEVVLYRISQKYGMDFYTLLGTYMNQTSCTLES